ncbi:MAG: hypothetical protein IJU16_06275, partial [Clostridia bacterium]|nr:hypothetical protein [Clostridia bacterium]
ITESTLSSIECVASILITGMLSFESHSSTNEMLCGAKLPILFSFLFSLFTGKSRGGERREK